jgi:hypothetical protein
MRETNLAWSPAPVILISTHAEQDYAELIAASPAIGFLPKTALSGNAIRDPLPDELAVAPRPDRVAAGQLPSPQSSTTPSSGE